MASMNYWLLKSEPTSYSIADLARDQATIWDGVRNYQARNFLRSMQVGDLALFYHSNTAPPGIAGLAKVVEASLADPTQFDSQSQYFDPKSTRENPRWQTVKVAYDRTFPRLIGLDELKQKFTAEELGVVRSGSRLSVMPVDQAIARRILALAELT
ncbi:MAG: EVE domain-containing protein [Microcoleus sp. SIO2G3]|nr:EVE domain-containing protein [Microcoleus sp. SIO2G3]